MESAILIVFGATGDLVQRKIIPSIFSLYKENKLPEKFKIFAFARRDFTNGKYKATVEESLKASGADYQDKLEEFFSMFEYIQGDFDKLDDYKALADKIREADAIFDDCSKKLFYLAVPPEYYKNLFQNLKESQVTMTCIKEGNEARILVEKPFGKDLKSAEELDMILAQLFEEDQIYRIDHYLAKDTLNNISTFRFANTLFEPIWNNKYIERIEIRTLEALGVEKRGNFYDGIGALRDMGQNHLLQMLAFITMEKPEKFDAKHLRESRENLLKHLVKMSTDEIKKDTYRAQYKGYREIENVKKDSNTETYFKIKAFLDLERWKGIPIVMEAGKKFGMPSKSISIVFKKNGDYPNNIITFEIEPEEALKISITSNIFGNKNETKEKEIQSSLREAHEKKQYIEEYTQLIFDAINSDQRQFVSSNEVKYMWEFIDPIVLAWQENLVPLEYYEPGIKEIKNPEFRIRN